MQSSAGEQACVLKAEFGGWGTGGRLRMFPWWVKEQWFGLGL